MLPYGNGHIPFPRRRGGFHIRLWSPATTQPHRYGSYYSYYIIR